MKARWPRRGVFPPHSRLRLALAGNPSALYHRAVRRRSALALIPALALAPPAARAQPDAQTPEAIRRLAARLARLDEDGLDPRHYALPDTRTDPARFRADTLRAASAALADLALGRVRDPAGRPDIRRDPAAAARLAAWQAELAQSPEPAALLDRVAALTPDAVPLKAELARLRAIAAQGGYPRIQGDLAATLEPGAEDPARVPQLRARLALTDPSLTAGAKAQDPVYDEDLQAAVQRFQEAAGLEADGRIGRLTWTALNRPVESQLRQLRVALDMRRAAPPPSAERRIEVNIPQYRLRLMDGPRKVLDMAVIVGRPDRQTPLLRVRMNAVQFNPRWGVPERNAREDLLPRFRRDPAAMTRLGFRLYRQVDGETVEVNPASVNWTALNRNNFPYVVRQDAGELNALGRIKFIMPNNDDIYMHDTPDRGLFRRPDRAFSSGCIRLERPLEMLDAALAGTPGWDRARAEQVLASRATTGISMARAIPVYIQYGCVVVEGGAVRIRPDVYGLDEAYARALDGRAQRMAEAR